MTIILSFVGERYALQLSDRLLTQELSGNRFDEFDSVSNKSIILLARNALVSFGYCGQAYIRGLPTDEFVARVFLGEQRPTSRTRQQYAVALGGDRPDLTLGRQLMTLAQRLNDAARTRDLVTSVTLDYVGFCWRPRDPRRFAWPCFGRLYRDSSGHYTLGVSKRYWGWLEGKATAIAIGRSHVVAQDGMIAVLNNMDPSDREQVINKLIGILRGLPPEDSTVGRDCLVTVLQREVPQIRIRYEPYSFGHVLIAIRGGSFVVPVVYTPWIVTQRLVSAPQIISGERLSFNTGGLNMVVDVPDSKVGFYTSSSQRRRPWP